MGVSPKTIRYYRDRLDKFTSGVNYVKAKRRDIERYLNTIRPNKYGLSTRHASYRAIKAFYRWLSNEYGIDDVMSSIPAPIMSRPILPSLAADDVHQLIEQTDSLRDKAIIALFTESGLRLTELTNIKPNGIDWQHRLITKYWVRVEKRLMPHLVSSQPGIYEHGLPNTSPTGIFGVSISGALHLCFDGFKKRLACPAILTHSGGPLPASCAKQVLTQ
jgi:site-specific recombinase XerD